MEGEDACDRSGRRGCWGAPRRVSLCVRWKGGETGVGRRRRESHLPGRGDAGIKQVVFPGEALPSYQGHADPRDFPEYGQLLCIICGSGSGGLLSLFHLLLVV